MAGVPPPPQSIDPVSLLQALGDSGWLTVGGSRDVLRLESPPDQPPSWILVPVSRDVPDADALIDIAWRSATEGSPDMEQSLSVALQIRRESGHRDSLRFRKETDAPRGLIAWSAGEALIEAARLTLLAGAKAFQSKAGYFGNTNGRFAHRYLDACFMGQTGVGSYIVTALTPIGASQAGTHERVDLPGSKLEVDGRQVTESVVRSLTATVEAIDHYNQTKSTSGFGAAVQSGMSADMVRGLQVLAEQAEEATIVVEWDPAIETMLGRNEPVRFELSAADVPALTTAHTVLTSPETADSTQTVKGRVHLLTKQEAGAPGVVGIDTGTSKFRVRLSPEGYHRAVQAHDAEDQVVVTGRASREGNLNWLYDATLVRVIPRDDVSLF